MAYTSGTAANYKDLLAVLASFAAANGWTVLEQTAASLVLCGSGLAGLDEIYCAIDTYENSATSAYQWRMYGAWGFRPGKANRLVHCSPAPCLAYFWNAAMPYWMVANGRRLIVAARVGTTYQMAHLGLLTPPATDAQYPYPLLIAGSGSSLTAAYSTTSLRAFWATTRDETNRGGWLHQPGGEWAFLARPDRSSSLPSFYAESVCSALSGRILSGLDGTYLLEPVVMVANRVESSTPGWQYASSCFGRVEGLFRVSGHNNTAENIITVDGVNYLVLPDTALSGFGDFCALMMT
ncbi:MAG: hypothetical protein ACOX5Z_00220 [Desulfobulbus sp.]|jgi:hypothetical protein